MQEALRRAIRDDDRDAVLELLAERPELADALPGELSPVLLALYHRKQSIAELLLSRREQPASLAEAAALGLDTRVAEVLADNPDATAHRGPDGFTPLHLAAYFGRAAATRLLLEAGADVEATAPGTRLRPLHSAVAGGNDAVVEAILAAGADVEARQEGGHTPLMGAASGGSSQSVRRLLEAGADPAVVNEAGKAAADLARDHGHDQVALELEKLDS